MVNRSVRKDIKSILLIELAGIGDVVLSSAAIKNLKECYPRSSIYYLTFSGPAELVKKSPYLDKVFTFSKGFRGIIKNIFALIKLRKLHIDIAINLYQHYTFRGALSMALLLRIIKPKRTFGRNTDGKGFFYDIKIEDTINTERHDVEYKLDLIKALGCDVKNRNLEIWFGNDDVESIGKLLEDSLVLDSDLLIGMNPGAYRPSHCWYWKNFAEVGDILAEKYKAKIIITGSENEHELAERIIFNMTNKAINTAGQLSLSQLVALIKKCNLYITNDTGPMHIANALAVPLVAIMGSGTMKTAPYHKDNCIILRKKVKCAPCYKFKCKDMRCLNAITVSDVIEASIKLLKK